MSNELAVVSLYLYKCTDAEFYSRIWEDIIFNK